MFQDKKYLLQLYNALHPEDSIIGQNIIFCKVYNEQILEAYAEDIKNNEARKTAERMMRDGDTLEKISRYVTSLSMKELKELET